MSVKSYGEVIYVCACARVLCVGVEREREKSDTSLGKKSDIGENREQESSSDFVRNGKSHIRSAAAIRCLLFMKWYYKVLYPFCWIIPFPIRDLVYSIISKNRHRIFTKPEICSINSLNDY